MTAVVVAAVVVLAVAAMLVAAFTLGRITASGTRPGDRKQAREWSDFQASMRGAPPDPFRPAGRRGVSS